MISPAEAGPRPARARCCDRGHLSAGCRGEVRLAPGGEAKVLTQGSASRVPGGNVVGPTGTRVERGGWQRLRGRPGPWSGVKEGVHAGGARSGLQRPPAEPQPAEMAGRGQGLHRPERASAPAGRPAWDVPPSCPMPRAPGPCTWRRASSRGDSRVCSHPGASVPCCSLL